ncbi:MAG: UvrD-helicase domain-containing protein [Neisseriaceae bacterium]|nr:UvrD-helicase domain-containing protein [Neisseriaceae bacterium]
MKFNQQQLSAIQYLDAPLLVLAGAGSGKTRVITHKIVHLIENAGYLPQNIAAITFTNKAAREMRERINAILPNNVSGRLNISTFHSLGMKILQMESEHLKLKKNFSIFDAADSNKIIGELTMSSGKEAVSQIQHQISLWKNALISPEQAVLSAQNDWELKTAQIYASYRDTLQSYQAVDLDDLIRLPCQLFNENSEIKYKWQFRLQYLLIDECQDTNASQYTLLRHLTGNEAKFTAVGDDDQSIYAWRGANVHNLHRLQEDYPNLKIIKLEQNYRSTQNILRAANGVISHNQQFFEKKLWSSYEDGDKVCVITCQDERHEADTVVQKIQFHQLTRQTNYSDYAILYRGNHQAKTFEEALRSAKIPYVLSGGQSFFEKTEIKDVLAYMRLLANTDDDQALLRTITTPKRGIGEAALEKLNYYATLHKKSLFATLKSDEALNSLPSQTRNSAILWHQLIEKYIAQIDTTPAHIIVSELLKEIHYETYLTEHYEGKSGEIRWRNVLDLIDWLEHKSVTGKKSLPEITRNIALMNILEGKNENTVDAVRLSTLHSAKGLEYPYVFLIGCEEGLFPHENSIEDGNIEEERRLMYVGITRAKKTLTLTHCVKRKRGGHWYFTEPSRFLSELPENEIQFLGRKNTAPIVSHEEGNAILDNLLKALDEKTKKR